MGLIMLFSLIITSCASSNDGSFTDFTQPQDCGSEINPGFTNKEGRDCFYSAYQKCQPATFHVGYQTHEGMDRHELTIVSKNDGVCKVKHVAEIKYISKTYESVCSLVVGEKFGRERFLLSDCEREETVEMV